MNEEYKVACEVCGEVCEIVEVTFDYSGTHCNHGKPGIHKTGEHESACCSGGYEEAVSCESCDAEKHKSAMTDAEIGYFCENCTNNPSNQRG